MIDLDYIQQCLDKKAIDNTEFCKLYFLDRNAMTVTKIKPNSYSKFEFDCISYFCKFYRDILGLNFKAWKEKDKLTTIAPVLDIVHTDDKINKEKLLSNMYSILDKFVQQNKRLSDMLISSELHVKAYIQDIATSNFFWYNNEAYLLDLETFYFCIYTPEGYNIGLAGVNEEYEQIVKSYIPAKKAKDQFLMDDMLIY